MEIAFSSLSKSEDALLMGDFNFDPSWKKEQDCIDKHYTDLFLHAGGD